LQWKSRSSLRRTLRWVWIYFLYWTGLILWARRRIESSAGIIVLTFHRVLEDEDVSRSDSSPGMIVRRSTFEDLLRFLTTQCEMVSLAAVPSWAKRKNRLRIAVTFDDGWRDTSEIAFPLTQKWRVPTTVFVCPGLVGKAVPFWPEHVGRAWRIVLQYPQQKIRFETICREAGLQRQSRNPRAAGQLEALLSQLKQLPASELERTVQKFVDFARATPLALEVSSPDATMTWEETARIASQGAQIGSHTQSHQILTTISASTVQSELSESKRILESRLALPCTLFAYPNGYWSTEVHDHVVKAGYSLAFVNSLGIWNSDIDLWLIPRVNIWEGSLIGPSGRFSPAVFLYLTLWRTYRAEVRRRKKKSRSQRAGKDFEAA
jgi:peptidoglycan/xylan/chitin deacetylase (PgdA/CDA1 family)